MPTRAGRLQSDPFRHTRPRVCDLRSLLLPSLPRMTQVAAAGSALLAHPSNSDHDTNPDGWLLEYVRAGRVLGSPHRLASGHPQCTHQHLTGAPLATPLLPMGALKNRACLLHSLACFSHMQGNQIDPHYVVGFCLSRLRGNVSDITTFTTTPERNVSTPITPIAHGTPNSSASTPASSAPMAYPLSRQSR